MNRISLLLFVVICLPFVTQAEEESAWSGNGQVSFEGRVFTDDDDDSTEDRGLALFTRLETTYEKNDFKFVFRAFARVDRYDRQRDVFAPEDAFLQYNTDLVQLKAGYQIFNWSGTEVFHPVDTINSRNFDSNIENQEKLGELTFSAKFDLFEGDVTLFYFPKYENPIQPGQRSRLGIDFGFEVSDPEFVEKGNFVSTDNFGHQYGVRLTQSISDADISLHYLRFMDRLQPLYFFDGRITRPHLFMMNQYGGTYTQILKEGLIGKVEFIRKDFISTDRIENIALPGANQFRTPIDHNQLAVGLEWGWGNSNGSDTTIYAEYQKYMADSAVSQERVDELGLFQNDAFIGVRHAFNDVKGKELVVSLIRDMKRDHEYLFQTTYSQRINEFWKIRAGLRYIDAPVKSDRIVPVGLEVLDEDHQFSLAFSRFF